MPADWPLLSDIPPETFVVTVREKFLGDGVARAALAGLGKRRNVVCLYPDSSPAPLLTSKAYLPSRAKQRLQGLYPLLRASSADLKRTVQALQLK